MVCGLMDVEIPKSNWDKLYDPQPEKVELAVRTLKDSIIGSRRQKEQILQQGLLAQLVNLLVDPDTSPRVKTNIVHIIGSISKGTEVSACSWQEAGVVKILLNGLLSSQQQLTEACLFSLVSIFSSKDPPVEVLYSDEAIISHLLSLMPNSTNSSIAVCRLLTQCCISTENQTVLLNAGTPKTICGVLSSPVPEARLGALRCLAKMAYKNESAAKSYTSTELYGKSLMSQIVSCTGRENNEYVQLEASRVLTYMFRSGVVEERSLILYRVLPCLVRLCRAEEATENRILAAETLAYLIELDVELQQIAAISNHLIPTVALFLKWEPDHQKLSGLTRVQLNRLTCRLEKQATQASQLKIAAFQVFASLSANDEDIRKRLIEMPHLVDTVVAALKDTQVDVKMAAIGCLHSLSRSVQLLRTTFQDHAVWEPILQILAEPAAKAEGVLVASSTLCNLLLDFSPSKEKILDSGAVELLCELTQKLDPCVRLNGVWGLMNLSFNAEERIKEQIMTTLGTDQVFRLLADTEIQVVMKTLGLLRNLLSNDKHHIDQITSLYGKQLMQAVVFTLESENAHEVKEQALCMLANIADGDASKKLIVDNEDMLKKLKSYMLHNNPNLQTAAVLCIQNLIWREDEGSMDRQAKLKDIGVFAILKQLLATEDTILLEKVKMALQQANM